MGGGGGGGHAKGQEDEEISRRAKIARTVRNFAQATNFVQAKFAYCASG